MGTPDQWEYSRSSSIRPNFLHESSDTILRTTLNTNVLEEHCIDVESKFPQTIVSEPRSAQSERTGMDEKDVASKIDDGRSCKEGTCEETRGELSKDVTKKPSSSDENATGPIKDPNLVTWDSPNDPQNPKNWSMKRKWAALTIVSCFTFISPVSSAMIAPALSDISTDFGITNPAQAQLTLSIFVLAYAVGPLFLGPLSEIYGRVITVGQLMVCRFFSGLGGSAPLAIGGGLLSDLFSPEQRGRAISIYSLGPLIGPALGPIVGGFVCANTTWRWCFYALSITTVIVQLCGFFFLQETYAPRLLEWKRDRLRKETGNQNLYTAFDSADRTLATTIKTALKRPCKLLATQPIVQVLACYTAYLYGLTYLMLSTFPILWVGRYGMPTDISSLNFISIALGFFIGVQVCSLIIDALYRHLKARNAGAGRPEYRIPMLIPASLLVPAGLFWYGWSGQTHMHWVMPNIGAAIFSAGVVIGFQCINTYLIDSYTRYAASAMAATTVLRSLAGFVFPLFAPAMYDTLGFGWGNSVLGFIAIGLGVPAPFMLWRFGEQLRNSSRFAA